MKKRITLKHIATEFNVSIATVSKALKDNYDISSQTREKIQQYALEHNYRPNRFALNLKNKQTKTVGIIIPNILNLFFAKVFSGIEKIANEKGYNLITCISNDSYQKEMDATQLLINGSVDGLIVSLAEETQKKQRYNHFTNAINQGIEVVMFDRVTKEVNCDKVIVDDFEAAYSATNFFIQTQCKHIAIISIICGTSVGKLRLDGYKNALLDNNIPIDKNLIITVAENDDLETLLKIVLGSRKVDAILCLEETSAVNAVEIVIQQGFKIPDDISIIGFTNGDLPRHVTPKITTVSQHGVFMGEIAMNYLATRLNEIEGEESEINLKTIKTSLIERETTKRLS